MSTASSLTTRTVAVVVAVALLPLLAVTLFSPFYQTNDDVAMRLLAEGNFVPGGGPTPFLMHVNILVGVILRLAYGLIPRLPWYDLVMGAGLTAAWAALLAVWAGSGKWDEICWAVLFGLFFLLPAFVSVQFSLVGLGCAGAGIALLVRALAEPLQQRARRVHLLFGGGLLVWGALVRFEGAVLMMIEGTALALPFAIAAWRDAEARPRLRGALFAGCVALALATLSFAANQFVYARARGWREFHEYNFRRSSITEYTTPERVTPRFVEQLKTQVGWSYTDFTMFSNWFFTDPEVFSLARVRKVEALLYGGVNQPKEDWYTTRLKSGVDLSRNFFVETRLAFLVMGAFVVAGGARARVVLYFLGTALTIAVLIAGIGLALKAPPPRIFWPMLLLGAAMLPIAARRWGRPAHPAVALAAMLLAGYPTGSTLCALWKEDDIRRSASERSRSEVAGLRRTGAKVFILHGNSFPYEDYWRPLHVEKTPFPFIALGVSARTPPVQGFLRRTGRTDLPLSLCSEPGLLIVAPDFIPNLLTAFVAEHDRINVHFEPIFRDRRLTAWRCLR